MKLKLNQKPSRRWEWREYKKGCLIENGIALNNTGTFIWRLCDGETSIDEIILKLTENYKVERKTAQRDVLKLIKILWEEKCIQFI